MIKRVFTFSFCLVLCTVVYAQTGPAGVGSSTSNILWLKVDEITGYNNGDDLATWADFSGNGNDLSQPEVALYAPNYITNELNGLPVVRFTKSNGRIRRTNFTDFPTTAVTVFYVNRNSSSGDGIISYNSASQDNDFLIFDSSNLSVYRGSSSSSSISANTNTFEIINAAWRSSDGANEVWKAGVRASYKTGLNQGSSITQGGSLAIGGEQDDVDADYAPSQAHLGDFAEVIVFNTYLNQAQQIIVDNYLASKYALSISNDYYAYDTHPNEVAGIGRETDSEEHVAAMSANVLQIENATGLDADDEYLLFGHQGGDISTWSTTEVPDASTDVQRLSREWRFDESGDLGQIDFRVETASFPSKPTDFSMYVLMIDADGDFSDGASVYEMTLDAGTEYLASGIDINDGDYVALGVIKPTVSHAEASNNVSEKTGTTTINLVLNHIPVTAHSVEVSTADVETTTGDDYTALTNQVVNFSAGNATASYDVSIVDDNVTENTESLTITLSNPSSGIVLGANSVHTLTINDDDNPRKVYFTLANSSALENTGTASINVEISSADAVNPTTVDYEVTAGTAEETTDYTLGSGTLTISAGVATSAAIDVTMIDEALFELDETISITLSNPTNANLDNGAPATGTGILTHEFTIINDDANPTVQFSASEASGSEEVTSVDFEVALSTITGTDASVNYEVTGTAIGGGVDYTLADGAVTIPAGSTTANITAAIINDAIDENSETIIITLTSANNANLVGNTVFTYTIINNPVFGFNGPGGIGSSETNVLWLKPESLAEVADDTDITSWSDASGNANDFGQDDLNHTPRYFNNVVNGFPIVRFDETRVTRLTKDLFDDFPTSEISVLFVNNTSDTDDGLLSYAVSSNFNEFILLNSNNLKVYIGPGSFYDTNESFNNGWHIGHVDWSYANLGTINIWGNGTELRNEDFAGGRIMEAGGNLALGAEQDAYDGGYESGGQEHDGDFSELIMFNKSLNQTRKIIIHNYLSAKYDISLADNDIFKQDDAANGNFDFEMAAIGRISANDMHLDAQGGIARINNAQDLDDDEFLSWAHNNLELSAVSDDVPAGTVARLNRVWRTSELSTGGAVVDVGTIDISFDLTGLGTVDVSELVLLLDDDGTFLTGATQISNPIAVGDDVYRFEAISGVSNATYFTLATKDLSTTPLPIELLSFEADRLPNSQIKLSWTTASEDDNSHFTIERSHTFNDFKDIAIIGGAGNSSELINYEYIDNAPLAGPNYYRLRQTDFNGTYSHSDLVYVKLATTEQLIQVKAYPNPINRGDVLHLNIKNAPNELIDISVFDGAGNQHLGIQVKPNGDGGINVDTAALNPGFHLLHMHFANGHNEVIKVVIR